MGGNFEEAVSQHHFITCDGCNREILADDPPYHTRQEFTWQAGEYAVVLPRRDLCDACGLRLKQVITGYLPNCEWLLDEFKRERK